MNYPQQLVNLVVKYQHIQQQAQAAEAAHLVDLRRNLAPLCKRYTHLRPKPARPLTIPAIFRRSHDENLISDYLAYILNPAYNGLGAAPLAKLLELFGIDPGDLDLAAIQVHREYTLENGRIDLLLECEGQLILAIENKIYSPEGNQQTAGYARALEALFPDLDHRLVFLTRYGHHPSSKKFQPLSYKQLLAAFRTIPLAETISPRHRVLWNDFLEHLEVYIIMTDPEKFEFSEKALLYLENQAMLQDLSRAITSEWTQAIEFIERRVYAQLDGGPWKTRFNPNRFNWHQLLKPTWEPPGLSVHFEYHFGMDNYLRRKMAFMVDVEGNHAATFLSIFDQRYPALEMECRHRGIIYRPRQRAFAIAWKEYPIPQDIDGVCKTFLEAFLEFRFLEPEIDTAIAEYSKI